MSISNIRILIAGLLILFLFVNCTTREVRRVLVIHSYEKEYAGYPAFNDRIAKEFHKNGIDADLRFFYLDCEMYRDSMEVELLSQLIDSMADWKPEIILVNEDQATYSLLKSGNLRLKNIPIVFAGVNYPNWNLIKKYSNVTGFHDKISFMPTIEMAKELFGSNIKVFSVLDYTFLDKQIRSDIKIQLKNEKVMGLPNQELYQAKNDSLQKLGYTAFSAVSVRGAQTGNSSLIWGLSMYLSDRCYIQLKRDFTTVNISNLSSSPSLTVINEGFGFGEKLLGGYLTPQYIQVQEQVGAAVQILRGTKPADIPIAKSKKVYVVDWKVMSQLNIPKSKIPAQYTIIHMPFREKYNTLWTVLMIIGSCLVLLIIISLIFLYRREEKRKKSALYALEDEKETLALAIEGGNTFAWKLEDYLFIFESDFWKSLGVNKRKLNIDDLLEMTHPDYREIVREDWANMSVAKKKNVVLQCDFNGKGYQWWEFRYTTISLLDGKYRTAGLLLNIQDVKNREFELEDARRLAEKAELKESFLANMSHEIRTPLNAIVGFSNMLASDEDMEEEDKKEFVDTINKNSELLLKLINDILELSRIESGYMSFSFEKCRVDEFVNSVYLTHQMLIPSKLKFIKEEDKNNLLEIEVDLGRLTQVLTNFLNNAGKFTNEGSITLGYRYLSESDEVCIYVKDTGRGIPYEEQKIIFSRFYKQNEFSQGAGLGLSICQVIISKLNGRIELTSELGQGSCFSVVLPCTVIS